MVSSFFRKENIMSYRLYTQPLTMKTESKPIDGELLVDTEDGHILVYNEADDRIHSATKDLYGEMALDEYLIKLINEQANALFIRLDNVLVEYPHLKTTIDELKDVVEGLQETVNTITSQVNNEYSYMKQNTTLLLDLHESVGDLLQQLFIDDYLINTLERINKEYTHLLTLPNGIKTQLGKDVTAVKAYRNEVKAKIDTKVSKTEYTAWVNKYVKDVNALTSNITFRHIG